MKKLLISTSIIAALGLAGCGGGETIEDLQADVVVQAPVSRIVFDPANGNLNIPNDLLMLPSGDSVFDYTLNIPVADANDFSDPQNALNTQDGWATSQPFQINVNVPARQSLDANTLAAGVRIFEATLGLDPSDAECLAIQIPSAGCKMGAELSLGTDFALSLADSDTINVVPLRPLKGGQGYMLVMTNALKDSTGKSVEGSTTWDLVKQDVNTNPLGSDAQLRLQGLVNSYITALSQVGYTRDEVTYVQVFTTVSTDTVLSTIKQLQIAPFATTQNPATLPAVVVSAMSESYNAMEKLGVVTGELVDGAVATAVAGSPALQALQPIIDVTNFSSLTSCNGLFAAAGGQFTAATGQDFGSAQINGGIDQLAQGVSQGILGQAGPLCAATLFEGNINLPYYSGVPSVENPLAPINQFWKAACTSGIILAAADPSVFDAEGGPNQATCQAAGLADVRVGGQDIDPARRVTKFSPIVQMNGRNNGLEQLDVQVTVPNPEAAAALGRQISMPEGGWPVVMLMHGITSKKEDMLSITGTLSLAGFATVAIDQPLHGSRGFNLDGEPGDELNASTVSATHFLNLASLPTARDNTRQSVADLLGLRLGINAVVDATESGLVNLNGQDVSFMGVSLGAITGSVFTSIANTPFDGALAPLSGMYSVQAAVLESPGSAMATFLLESPSFGPLIKGNLLRQASTEFQAFLQSQFGDNPVSEAQLVAATNGFLGALDATQLAAVNAIFSQFAFAAQTMVDPTDPVSYGQTLGSNTNVLMFSVVGDGGDNLPDQVIPIATALPLSGQLPLAGLIGLDQIVESAMGESAMSGLVKFNSGAHASSINPASSAAVTREMQLLTAAYLASKGRVISIENPSVISTN